MKGVVIGGRVERNPVIVQGAAAVLVGEPFAQLPVGKHLPPEKGLEVEVAESFPVDRIGTMVHASQTAQETAPIR